jgi:hypothetical protein
MSDKIYKCVVGGNTFPIRKELADWGFKWDVPSRLWESRLINSSDRRILEKKIADGEWYDTDVVFEEIPAEVLEAEARAEAAAAESLKQAIKAKQEQELEAIAAAAADAAAAAAAAVVVKEPEPEPEPAGTGVDDFYDLPLQKPLP